MSIKFYRTFGHARRPRLSDAPDLSAGPASPAAPGLPAQGNVARRPLWRWLPVILVPVIALSIVSVVVLFLNVYRGDYKNTRMIAFERTLNFWLQGEQFQVGQRSAISLTLANPLSQPVVVKRAEIRLPARFLDAFTVDAGRCSVQRNADASGVVTCTGLEAPGGKNFALAVPVVASRPGNYDGQINLNLELAVPAPDHPWYVTVDGAGNYILVLLRSRTLDLRITP